MWDLGSMIWISALIIVFEDGDLGDTCGQTKSIHNQSAPQPDLPILSHCSVTTLPHFTRMRCIRETAHYTLQKLQIVQCRVHAPL